MNVNVAVCGTHLQHHFVRYLQEAGLLQRFYYSHRIATNARALGLAPERAVNLWPSAYLTHGHLRLLGQRGSSTALPLYARLWQLQVLATWQPCDALYFVIQAEAASVARRARRDGSVVVGHPVNSHPANIDAILAEEHERLGLPPYRRSAAHDRFDTEIALCDWIVAPSQYVARSYAANGFDPTRMRVAPFAVDSDRFWPADASAPTKPAEAFRVICVAQISPRKGQRYLLEAWQRLNLPNAELLLIGAVDPVLRPTLARHEGQYHHIANVPNTALREHYLSADVFVLPTLEDGFGIVCAEAMACGLPVITTNQAGAAELVDDRVNGRIVPAGDADALAEAIAFCRDDPERLQAMSRAATQRSRAWTWRDHANVLIELFRELAD